eukprot:scaffold63337_cov68-Phaeocystis_antarctica.AAC.2
MCTHEKPTYELKTLGSRHTPACTTFGCTTAAAVERDVPRLGRRRLGCTRSCSATRAKLLIVGPTMVSARESRSTSSNASRSTPGAPAGGPPSSFPNPGAHLRGRGWSSCSGRE